MNKTKDLDAINLYRGIDHKVNDYISIHIPTIDDICNYGELDYYSMVNTLCSVPINLCWQLDKCGINYEDLTDYQLFVDYLCRRYTVQDTRILFGDILDFSKMDAYFDKETEKVLLMQKHFVAAPIVILDEDPQVEYLKAGTTLNLVNEFDSEEVYTQIYLDGYEDYDVYIETLYVHQNDSLEFVISDNDKHEGNGLYHHIVIDEDIYKEIVTYLRAMHNLKRDDRIAGTESCRKAFIEDAEMEYEALKYEEKKSVLMPMISTLVNIEGFPRNDETIFQMNIYAFMDSVKRIGKIKNSTLLLQSGYSGFGIDLKKINKNELDYMGELN